MSLLKETQMLIYIGSIKTFSCLSFHQGWIYISQPPQPKLGCSKPAHELWLCSCHRSKWKGRRDTHWSLGRSRASQPVICFCSYCTSALSPRQTAPLLQQPFNRAPALPNKHRLQAGHKHFSQPQAATLSLFKWELKSPKENSHIGIGHPNPLNLTASLSHKQEHSLNDTVHPSCPYMTWCSVIKS